VEELVAEWVAQRAQPPEPELTPQEVEARRRWLKEYGGLCASAGANASGNEGIDADLARDYGR
jgi:hypothetical protein